jgi:ureidoglycolate lyase
MLEGRSMRDVTLRSQALNAAAFAPFGDVIEIDGRESRSINDATCRRFDDLARIDVTAQGGRASVSIFEADARPLPLRIRQLERHPLGSQAFVPLEPQPFLIVVAEERETLSAESIRVFLSSGRQGVNYRRNVWHHPLIALHERARFLVIDRAGIGENCEEKALTEVVMVVASADLLPNFAKA